MYINRTTLLSTSFLVASFIGLSSTLIFAQEGVMTRADINTDSLKGIVLDAKKEPIIGAKVTLMTSNNATNSLTDFNGTFSIPTQTEVNATDTLVIDALGFTPMRMSVGAFKNQNTITLLELPKSQTLDEVTIKRRKQTSSIGMIDAAKVEKIGAGELMKAACCNLSESFETTPSVDVGFTDAISGYKQIQMLGLSGPHTAITRENIPDARGLGSIIGLTFTPGTFVESMQLSKGAGSVVNGYEGTAGQINVEWIKPFEEKNTWILNGYQSSQGRSEGNAIYNKELNSKWSTNILLHGRGDWAKVDQNNDEFLDSPLGKTFVGANRWFYMDPKGYEVQFGVKGAYIDQIGGHQNYSKNSDEIAPGPNTPWGYENNLKNITSWAKLAKIYVDKPWKSMALQLSYTYHDQHTKYGIRQYTGNQNSWYSNYIFQTIINNTNNTFKFGASSQGDHIQESLDIFGLKRNEITTGAFAEYSYKYLDKFNLVAGIRADYSNLYGAFFTPRVHMRYAFSEKNALRASIGRAQRTVNYLSENLGLLASNRNVFINYANTNQLGGNNDYMKNAESAWNFGLNFTQKFTLNYQSGSVSVDAYHTSFNNQVVTDIETPGAINFYELKGKSFANNIQAQIDYEWFHNFSTRFAYRYYDIQTDYDEEGRLFKPLVAKHRLFANVSYATKNDWKFDYTIQLQGKKRIPSIYHNTHLMESDWSKPYVVMNAQINKSFKEDKYEIYLGGENLLNKMQHPMIQNATNTASPYFDAAMIYGQSMGINIYAGFKLKI